MAVFARCPHCGSDYRLRDDAPIGAEVICSECRQTFALQPQVQSFESAVSSSDRWFSTVALLVLLTSLVALGLLLHHRRTHSSVAAAPATTIVPRSHRPAPTPPTHSGTQPQPSIPVEQELRERRQVPAPPSTSDGRLPDSDAFQIVIDASKGGGVWWSPQANRFDPNRHHQGKAAADLLRSRGWDVEELPRGQRITSRALDGRDVLIRLAPFSSYSVAEANMYQQAVASGATLILIGDGNQPNDPIARNLGIRFGERNVIGEVTRWHEHSLTKDVSILEGPWTTMVRLPTDAVELAWLEQSPTQEVRPVMGLLPLGEGLVVFIGAPLHLKPSGRAFLANLIQTVHDSPRMDLLSSRTAPIQSRTAAAQLPSPQLLVPRREATLAQPRDEAWHFEWEPVPGADSYELVVLGPNASIPLIRRVLKGTDYTSRRTGGYIVDRNCRGWRWRVRGLCDSEPGAWSDTWTFDVASRHE